MSSPYLSPLIVSSPYTNKPQQLNTSTLGHNLVPTKTTKLKDRSIIPSALSSALNSVESKAAGELNDIAGDVADKLAAKLGIKQWYSLHLSDMCEGTYSPNATAERAKKHNITCTNSTTKCTFFFPVLSSPLFSSLLKSKYDMMDGRGGALADEERYK